MSDLFGVPVWAFLFAGGVSYGVYLLAVYLARHRKKVLWTERSFEISSPFPLRGTPDLVMQEEDGSLVIHDLKTRASGRVMRSDVIQLSLYRMLVARATGRRVSMTGVVRFGPGGATQKAVGLLGDDELVAIHGRYFGILSGNVDPLFAEHRGLCQKCQYHCKECFPTDALRARPSTQIRISGIERRPASS